MPRKLSSSGMYGRSKLVDAFFVAGSVLCASMGFPIENE
jgi:hypothetical protein